MELQQIIDRPTTCKLAILNSLYQNDNWTTLAELESRLMYNRKTLQKYLLELQQIIDIQFSGNKGFKLIIDKMTYRKTVTQLLEKNIPFQIIHLIVQHSSVSLYDLIDIFNFSEATIKRHLKVLKSHLKVYNVLLVSRKGRYELAGNERTIRYYLYSLYWSIYRGVYWPFSFSLHQKIENKLNDILVYFPSFKESAPIIEQLTLVIAIDYIRFFMNNPIVSDKIIESLVPIITDNPMYQSFYELYVKEFYLNPVELQGFILFLHTKTTFYDLFDFDYYTEQPLISQKHIIAVVNKKCLDEFSRLTKDNFIVEDKFIKANICAGHFHSYLYPSFNESIDGYNVMKYMREQHMSLVIEAKKIITEISLDIEFKTTEYLVSQYALLLSYVTSESHFLQSIKINIFTDFPILINKIIERRIQLVFQNSFNILFVDSISQEADLLLTIPNSKKNNNGKKLKPSEVVYISPELTLNELYEVKKACQRINSRKHQKNY